ncbi:receptor-like protein EIX1 [Manihot esculenta]|uniref:receptor-like protein EIX1 n=1 Tax=Manihot esculenta TaxID=3983 RepID=UPI001CC5CAF9|nr:receptor-like protein EIX1 [Manihot esculenta]
MGTSTANVVEILALLILLQSVSSFCNGDNFNGSCIKTEREALVKFKSSLHNNSNSLPSWVGDDCCRWHGVTCDDITGHVVKLVLSRASIMGNISLHLGNLSNLQYLDLSWNQDLSLNRSLAIHSLHFPSSLKYLNLSYVLLDKCDNWLQSINMLPSLLELELRNCELSIIGDVSHVNFTSLEVLDLGLNNFHSTIPSWLYNITKLQNLDLYSSAFRGSLSTDISNLNSLASLNAGFNSLEGNIPNTLNRLCNLIELYLGYNKFSGEISGTFGNSSGCIKNSLENLYLLNNSFSGSIPDNLGQFKRLKDLSLSKNSFWGSIPVSIGQLYNLERLGLSKNSLHGKVSELHLLNLRSLIELSMDGNSLVFDIDPEWIPPFQLYWIGLSSCDVGPSFPQWLKTQKSIRFLEMSNASISDNIPDWFENISSNIVGLDLSYNQLFGTLPTFRKLNTTYANEYRIILLKSNQFDDSPEYQ